MDGKLLMLINVEDLEPEDINGHYQALAEIGGLQGAEVGVRNCARVSGVVLL